MENDFKAKSEETRNRLKSMSNEVKEFVENGLYANVNQAIIDCYYTDESNQVFKKFREWKSEGKKIKKGSKAFPVWARPKEVKKEESTEAEEDYSFYPICYLFSNSQVE